MTSESVGASRPLLRNRDFMLLWGGQLASWVGTEVTGIALPLLVLALTGSPALAGTIAAVRSGIYVLLALPAGALVDRWDRRRVMVLANAGSGLAMGSIGVALALGRLALAQLYLASALEGACFVFANLARFSALRRVVPREQYPAAVAQTSMADSLALLVGPPLGGSLYQLAGASVAILADACSYFINALSIFYITSPLQDPQERPSATLVADIRSGIAWLWRQELFKHLSILTAGRTAIASSLYLVIIVLARHAHASAAAIGGIFAVGALGGILGAAVASRLHHRFGAGALLWVTTGATWVLVSCYLPASSIVVVTTVTAAIYFVSPLYEVALASGSAVVVPDALRGRVSSLFRLVELGAYGLGFLVTGLVLQSCGSTVTIMFLSAILLALTLFARLNPRFRTL